MDVAKKSRRPPDEDLEETSHFNSPSQGFFYLFLHLIISTLWTRLLPHLAQSSSCVTLLAFPFLHFATLLVGFTWALRRTKGETAEDVMRWSSVVLLGRKAYSEGMYGKDRDRRRSLVRWTATSLVVSLLLHLWGSRWMIDREMEALDVFILPLVLLLESTISTYFGRTDGLEESYSLAPTTAVSAFLTGIALVGTPATLQGLAISLLRLPVQACSAVLLKLVITLEDDVLELLHATALAATLLAFIPIPLIYLLPRYTLFPTWNMLPLLKLLASVALSSAAQFILGLAVHHFPSISTVLLVIYPRNMILILDAALRNGRQELSHKTLQLFLAQSFGTFALGLDLAKDTTSQNEEEAVQMLSLDEELEEIVSTNRPTPLKSIYLYLCFLPLFLFIHQAPSAHSSLIPFASACSYLPAQLRLSACPSILPRRPAPTVDLVVSYYDEDLHMVRTHLTWMRRANFVARKTSRLLIYNKGTRTEVEIRKGLVLRSSDEVVQLENFGREGATYLKHILLHYNETTFTAPIDPSLSELRNQLRRDTLADYTFFLQPHLATGIIAVPRLWELQDDVGFVHLGILLKSVCGEDDAGTGSYPLVGQIFNMFREQVCPPTGQTIGWTAQFLVSKRRILANGYEKYAELDRLLEAPSDHWLHSLWGPNGSKDAGNPAFGHSVERAWPIIFDCWDPRIAEECPGRAPGPVGRCQCIDL